MDFRKTKTCNYDLWWDAQMTRNYHNFNCEI